MENAYAIMSEDASGRKPPFFRFGLHRMEFLSYCNPTFHQPSLYVGMERVPNESWIAFWSRIEPILRYGNRFDWFFNVVVFAVFVGHYVFYYTNAKRPYNVCNFILNLLMLYYYSRRTRQAQLEAIRRVCRDEEERVFRGYGFALECDFEWGLIGRAVDWSDYASDLTIYFLPSTSNATMDKDESKHGMTNGYLRIELFNPSPYFCTWTPVSLASLASYSSLPTEFESLNHDIWTEFWTELCASSKECLVAYRQLWAVFGILFALLLTLTLTLSAEYGIFALVALILLLVGSQCPVLYAWYSFQPAMERRRLVVEGYVDRFARQGVYMESRKSYKSHLCSGLYRCHYLYLFPLQTTAALMP